MILRACQAIAVAVCLVAFITLHGIAGGLYGVAPYYMLDLSGTFDQISIAGEDVFSAMEIVLSDLGVPPSEMDTVRAEFDEALDGIEGFAETIPLWCPVPLLGVGVEFGLPLVVIEGVRISGGVLTDGMLEAVTGFSGFEISRPLVDAEFEFGDYAGSVAADLGFSSWMLSTEVIKRVDLLVLGLNLGVGVDLIGGRVAINAEFDLPVELQEGVDGAVAAMHLDAMNWSCFAIHGTLGFELGPPFFRLYGDFRWLIPVEQVEEWWRIRVAPIAGMIGFVIRF